MFDVDLRRDRFVKVWRVTSDKVVATAAVIRRRNGFSAGIHYSLPDGRTRTWRWRTKQRSLLTGREAVQSIISIDRGLQSLPGTHLRIDFPHASSRAEQVLILMEHGLLDIVPEEAVQPDLEEQA